MSSPSSGGLAADRNLLFGVLALQADLLDPARFAEACSAWAARKDVALADLLQERGWLSGEERAHVEFLLDRKLKKHGGDASASLAEVMSDSARQTLAGLGDPVVHQTLTVLSQTDGLHERPTINYEPAGRERYTLARLHARGGVGQVWVAQDTDLEREVALKELSPSGAIDPTLVSRFLEEAKITGQLEHPNIVPVYELARPAGSGTGPFYTMRFVRGRTLAAAIKDYHARRQAGQTGTLELRELLGQFLAICNALAYAHSRGVLHRDLKPSNVVLGSYGEVIVLDWGLAKIKGTAEPRPSLVPVSVNKESSRDGTVQGQVIGTPSYMPPEQAEGRLDLVDERSDVYGLGAILYEILTGRPPFDGMDTVSILTQVVGDPLVAPRRQVPATPRPLDAICCKALAKKPTGRYASVKALAEDVQRWLADEPVTAYREPLVMRLGRRARRHRTLVAASVAAAMMALVFGGPALVWWQRDQARRREGAETTLARVNDLLAESRWADAGAALEQAEERLGNAGSGDLPRRIDRAKKDLNLANRLDKLRMARWAQSGPTSNDVGTDSEYETAFAEAGLSVFGHEPGATADKVTRSSIRDTLLAALDDWALGAPEDRRARIFEVARRADPDPWRDRLRDPTLWRDKSSLAPLAAAVPAEHITVGLAAAVGGHLALTGEGEKVLRAAQALRPGDFWLNRLLCRVAYLHGNPAQAEAYARVALAARPDSADANDALGVMLVQQRKLDQALPYFRNAVHLEPRYKLGYINLAKCLQLLGNIDEAVATLRKLQEFDPGNRVVANQLPSLAGRRGELGDTEAQYRKTLEVNGPSAGAHVGLGAVLHRQGREEEAIAEFNKAIQLEPGFPLAHLNLGFALDDVGRPDEAAAHYRKALQLLPNPSPARVNLAIHQARRGRYGPAVDIFQQVIKLAPGSTGAYANLANVLLRQGKTEESLAACQKAVELHPQSPRLMWMTYVNLAQAHLGLGQYAEAREAVRQFETLPVTDESFAEAKPTARRAALGERLAAVLQGSDRPANAVEATDFASICRYQWRLADAANLYARAFDADPKVAEDRAAGHRFHAVSCAALAACGTGKGAPADDKERSRLHRLAREWLAADVRQAAAASGGDLAARADARRQLLRWLSADDLSEVRDPAGLAHLPDAERKEWEAIWAKVRAAIAAFTPNVPQKGS
jgi:serine/threonine-protein kinase